VPCQNSFIAADLVFRHLLRRPAVLVDQAAENLLTLDPGGNIHGAAGLSRRFLLSALMRAMPVVVAGVLSQNLAQMPLAEDQDVIRALAPERAHEPLGPTRTRSASAQANCWSSMSRSPACGCRRPMPPGDIRESRLRRGRAAGGGGGPARNANWRRVQRRGLVQGGVRPVGVVEVLVLVRHGHQVALVPAQGLVQQRRPAGADPSVP
jgi:hypothetical protein